MHYRLTIAFGIVLAAAAALSAQPVYQLHDNGNLWISNGQPCVGNSCRGWHLLDNNPDTREIAAGGVPSGGFVGTKPAPDGAPPLYQRRADGTVWQYNGAPCKDGVCPGWQQLDKNDTLSIVAAREFLYQRRASGIWRFTGKACASPTSCPGWEQLDAGTDTVEIAAAGTHLYKRRGNGEIWRRTETGWELLENNSETSEITVAVNKEDRPALYQRRKGKILRYTNTPCNDAGACPGWVLLDDHADIISITTSSESLYQLRGDGSIRMRAGTEWVLLDNDKRNRQIAAGPRSLYKRAEDGSIWRFRGPACAGTTCSGWELFDRPPMRTIASTRN